MQTVQVEFDVDAPTPEEAEQRIERLLRSAATREHVRDWAPSFPVAVTPFRWPHFIEANAAPGAWLKSSEGTRALQDAKEGVNATLAKAPRGLQAFFDEPANRAELLAYAALGLRDDANPDAEASDPAFEPEA